MNITKAKPSLDLQELIDYGKRKMVGIILWASWYAIYSKLNEALQKYSAMGIKGFKIDFMDRDDQKMVASLYEIADKAATDYKREIIKVSSVSKLAVHLESAGGFAARIYKLK